MPRAVCCRVLRTSLPTPTNKPSSEATLPGLDCTPALHAMTPAFIKRMLSSVVAFERAWVASNWCRGNTAMRSSVIMWTASRQEEEGLACLVVVVVAVAADARRGSFWWSWVMVAESGRSRSRSKACSSAVNVGV